MSSVETTVRHHEDDAKRRPLELREPSPVETLILSKPREEISAIDIATAVHPGREYTPFERECLRWMQETDWTKESLDLSDPNQAEIAATLLDMGMVMGHEFGNFQAVTAIPEAIPLANHLKGRPHTQVASALTPPEYYHALMDPSAFTERDRERIMDMMDYMFTIGPGGMLFPAREGLPQEVVQHATIGSEESIPTIQLIAPGYRDDATNNVLRRVISMRQARDPESAPTLAVTSANKSRLLTGKDVEAAHITTPGLQAELGNMPGFFIAVAKRYSPEEVAEHLERNKGKEVFPGFGDVHNNPNMDAYPGLTPRSTTIIGTHELHVNNPEKHVTVERLGSLPLVDTDILLRKSGFEPDEIVVSPKAKQQPLRDYSAA